MNRKLLAGLATGAVAAVALTGAAFAHGGVPGIGKASQDEFNAKLAEKLGIDPAVLDQALKSTRSELMMKQLDAQLASLVEAGTITQAQADEIKAWVAAKPESLDSILPGQGNLFGGRRHGGFGHGRGHRWGPGLYNADATAVDQVLTKLVEAGTLTQAQADEIKAWLAARPAVLDELQPTPRQGFTVPGIRGLRFSPYGGQQSDVPLPAILQGNSST
jgi:hypothetical protein